jgi:hypothetical protein
MRQANELAGLFIWRGHTGLHLLTERRAKFYSVPGVVKKLWLRRVAPQLLRAFAFRNYLQVSCLAVQEVFSPEF